MLMYLTRFNERGRSQSDLDMVWKGYDFGIINELDEKDYIRQGNYRSKSVAITDEGMVWLYHKNYWTNITYLIGSKYTVKKWMGKYEL